MLLCAALSSFSNYACVIFVGSVLASEVICVLRITFSVGSIIALRVVQGKCHSIQADGIVKSILKPCDGILRCAYFLQRSDGN